MFSKKDEMKKERAAPSPYLALFYIDKKENNIHNKLRKTKKAYSKERRRQQDYLDNEIARLDRLLKAGSINEDIHTRYKKILKIDYAKKRIKTREKYGFRTRPHKF